MSGRTHLNKFKFYQQNKIKNILLQNGYDQETLNTTWNKLLVEDVEDIIDFELMEA